MGTKGTIGQAPLTHTHAHTRVYKVHEVDFRYLLIFRVRPFYLQELEELTGVITPLRSVRSKKAII